MNRLLLNMKNKVGVIDGAISHCKKLMNNEPIHLNGLHKFTITKGSATNAQLQQKINDLVAERQALIVRLERFSEYRNC